MTKKIYKSPNGVDLVLIKIDDPIGCVGCYYDVNETDACCACRRCTRLVFGEPMTFIYVEAYLYFNNYAIYYGL